MSNVRISAGIGIGYTIESLLNSVLPVQSRILVKGIPAGIGLTESQRFVGVRFSSGNKHKNSGKFLTSAVLPEGVYCARAATARGRPGSVLGKCSVVFSFLRLVVGWLKLKDYSEPVPCGYAQNVACY
ncbi:hypothetical protein EVAR_64285_1 [Eumeta japonica]|uniref:Uncharacterized protein n=1 Tax=Eumeta variegata TaxID=151549 RepID=A0A4C1ZNY1_EUMVA|nr:hypothetical protein EVAR_64285_1 [Eumeta japonica]